MILKLSGLVDVLSQQQTPGRAQGVERFLGYSRTQTFRLFKDWFGLSSGSYFRLRQFVHAVERLHQATDSLNGVGLESGYFDQPHFIRAFRDFAGMTPGQYRKHRTGLLGQLPF